MKYLIPIIRFVKTHTFIRDILLFALLIVSMHYLWKFWEQEYNFKIFGYPILETTYSFLVNLVFNEAAFILNNLLGISFTSANHTFIFPQGGYISIIYGCTGVKATVQFVILILFFRKNFYSKLLFIIVGIIILHITNLIRITGLSLVVINIPEHYSFFHHYFFRPLYYAIIFILWLMWIEKFSRPLYKNSKDHNK